MPKGNTLPDLYTKAMKDIGRGHGFYIPASPEVVRPGMCGYIDGVGTWRHIVDLTDKDALEDGRYSFPRHLVESKPRKVESLTLASEGVQGTTVGAGAGGGAGGIQGHFTFTLDDNTSVGAALVSTTDVFERGFEYESDLKKWARENRKVLLENRDEVKEHGFYVIQTTWTTQDVYINAWTSKTRSVSLDLRVQAAEAGQANATVAHTRTAAVDGGWVHPLPMDPSVPENHVIFFKGVRFRYLIASKAMPWLTETRGADDSESDEEAPLSPSNDPGIDSEELYLVPWQSDDEEEYT